MLLLFFSVVASSAVASSDTSSINSRNSFVNYDCSTLVIDTGTKFFLISKELAKSNKHGIKGKCIYDIIKSYFQAGCS